MTPIRLLAVSAFAVAITSCAGNKNGGEPSYDTNPPAYGGGQAGNGQMAGGAQAQQQPANPTYDTPAAYEESTGAAPAPDSSIVDPGVGAPRSTTARPSASHPAASGSKPATAGRTTAAPAAAGGRSHVVVKGDTLGGIATKYGVSQASIKQANNMTKDTVVLGKSLVIPGH